MTLKYNLNTKPNKNKIVHRCAFCFEKSIFRTFKMINEKTGQYENRLACTMCLNNVKYNKKMPLIQHRIIMKRPLNNRDKFKRQLRRIKEYFFGNNVYKPFKIRRRKKPNEEKRT
jgi:hypothetical protein